jgi:hypothetical protein
MYKPHEFKDASYEAAQAFKKKIELEYQRFNYGTITLEGRELLERGFRDGAAWAFERLITDLENKLKHLKNGGSL